MQGRSCVTSGALQHVCGVFLDISWCFQVQSIECCNLSVFLYSFGIYSIDSSTLIAEVLNINQLLLKLNYSSSCVTSGAFEPMCGRFLGISWHYLHLMYGMIKFSIAP